MKYMLLCYDDEQYWEEGRQSGNGGGHAGGLWDP